MKDIHFCFDVQHPTFLQHTGYAMARSSGNSIIYGQFEAKVTGNPGQEVLRGMASMKARWGGGMCVDALVAQPMNALLTYWVHLSPSAGLFSKSPGSAGKNVLAYWKVSTNHFVVADNRLGNGEAYFVVNAKSPQK